MRYQYQHHTSLFVRLSLSRWMRRTRPIRWCPWLPSPRSPSTSQPQMVILLQKMGPTPPPLSTDTLPPRHHWLTQRCESWRPWVVLHFTHLYTLPTSSPAASDCPHTGTNSTWIHQIQIPLLLPPSTCASMDNEDSNDEVHDYDDDEALNVKSLGPLAFAGVKRSLQYMWCVCNCYWDWDLFTSLTSVRW